MLTLILTLCLISPWAMAENSTSERLSQSVTQFSLAYYKLHIVNCTDNVAFSPFSLTMALTMLDLGARGKTAIQIDDVLGYQKHMCPVETTKDNETESNSYGVMEASDDYLKLLSALKGNDNDTKLDFSNVILVQEKYPILKEYVDTVQTKFMAKAEDVDFREGKSLDAVNEWVKTSTEGQITNLVEKIDVDTRLILGSAVYFKGKWAHPFDKEKTSNLTFHNLNEMDDKSVPAMFLEADLKVSIDKNQEGRFLELPYVNKDLSMILISPSKNRTLNDLETSLTCESLNKSLSQMSNVRVRLTLPRFKLASHIQAKDTLKQMGLIEAFGQANLTGITKTEGLTVSSVSQKTVIEVNEEGTKAASGTEVTGLGRSLPRIEEFKLDHPFLYLVRHNPSNVILFLGRVARF